MGLEHWPYLIKGVRAPEPAYQLHGHLTASFGKWRLLGDLLMFALSSQEGQWGYGKGTYLEMLLCP